VDLHEEGSPCASSFYSEAANVEPCVRELKRAQLKVSTDAVLTSDQFAESLKSKVYYVVVVEYPASNWQGTQALELLQ